MSAFISFNGATNKYPSRRSVVYGKNGMVCTSQTLAAQAGLEVLKNGGNAIDAAIATAISLTDLEPPSKGIGSVLFALVRYKGRLYELNGSGPAPMALTREKVMDKFYAGAPEMADTGKNGEVMDLSASSMPDNGWETVTVPGAPASWQALHKRFGAAEFASLFDAAIHYAEEGFPLQPVCSKLWKKNVPKVAGLGKEKMYQSILETFFADKELEPGNVVKLPEMGRTLRRLAESGCESFYSGAIAREIKALMTSYPP